MHPFSTFWTHQKTVSFPNVFRGFLENVTYVQNGWCLTQQQNIVGKEKLLWDLLEKSELCRMDNLIEQSQNKNSWLIISISILDKEIK